MKAFDLEAAKAGKPVCTRNGKKARIICFDAKNKYYPLVCLVETSPGYEEIIVYTEEGKYLTSIDDDNVNDLFMASTHYEGWINVSEDTKNMIKEECLYKSKEEAIACVIHDKDCYKRNLTTIKVEWDE